MRAEGFLRNWTYDALPWMHKKRCGALFSVTLGALERGELSVTGLGRSLRGPAKEKHNIKKADRLLSNETLQAELVAIYRAFARSLLGPVRRPVIYVDWSDIDKGQKFFLLRASTPVEGRSLTLYEEVHGVKTKEKRRTHAKFLQTLKEIIPTQCQPIVVTDAGFRGPWFQSVEQLGWDWIGRVRNREHVKIEEQSWQSAKTLYPKARREPKNLGNVLLTRKNALPCQLIIYKGRSKGRVRKTKLGNKARSKQSNRNAAREREPWLLATSLSDASASKVTKAYASRMQIEESFRDLKSARFGMSLEFSGTKSIRRFRILILVGSFAAQLAYVIGLAARSAKLHRDFQANTVSKTHVLSAVFLGIQVFRARCFEFGRFRFRQARRILRKLVAQHAFN